MPLKEIFKIQQWGNSGLHTDLERITVDLQKQISLHISSNAKKTVSPLSVK